MTSTQLKKSEHNLVWLDCEMTGLDPIENRLIEIAIVITSPDLSIRVEGPVFALRTSELALKKMDKWNVSTHTKSGLVERVRASKVTVAMAQQQLIDFLKVYINAGKAPMCGNTIAQDRRFLVRYMPKLEAFFHYRNLDVSTLKELAKRWKPEAYKSFKKKQRHTALADVHESIDELIHYRETLMKI